MDLESVTMYTDLILLNKTDAGMPQPKISVPNFLAKELPGVLFVTGFLLNILLVIYFVKSKRYKNPLFAILTFLAVMDTCGCIGAAMYSIFLFPTMVSRECWFLCPPAAFLAMFGSTGSEYMLLFFTAVRFYQVISPFKALALVTTGAIAKWCLTLGLLCAAGAIWFAIRLRPVTIIIDMDKTFMCQFTANPIAHSVSVTIFQTTIPCVGILTLHIGKYVMFVRSSKSLSVQQERKNPDGRAIAIVIVIFYICWMPSILYMIIGYLSIEGYEHVSNEIYVVLLYLKFGNCIANPIVYVLAMKSMRDDIVKLFCLKRPN